MNGGDHPSHPLADLFPLMEGDDFAALVEDIRQNGLREPIVMSGGLIVDGRNRFRACRAGGVKPEMVELPGGTDPLAFVLSKNLHRRHLTVSQRAMIAARLANDTEGGDRVSDHSQKIDGGRISAGDAARLLHISRPQVFQAKTILQHGTPDEIAAVARGEANVSTLGNQIRARAQDEGDMPPPVPRPRKSNGGETSSGEVNGNERPKRGSWRKGKGGIKTLPQGMTVEAAARRAVELRKDLGSFEAVTAQVGVPRHAIREIVNIVQLADRSDLSERDARLVATALRLMNENEKPIAAIYKPVAPIAQRVWGAGRGEKSNAPNDAREAARLDRFDRGLGIMLQSCANATRIVVPHLAPDHARRVLKELAEAITNIRVLERKIRGIHQ
jgi:hypothetical protein